jgi:hypothetical protein
MKMKILLGTLSIVMASSMPFASHALETISRDYNGTLWVYTCPNSCVVGANGSVRDSGGAPIQVRVYQHHNADK